MNRIILCSYCMNPAALVTGKEIYPHRADLHALKFWQCKPCDAWVGVHEGTENPLGRLANRELRLAKSMAHTHFDPLWKSGRMTRRQAYAHMQQLMGMTPDEAHIGKFNVEECMRLVKLLARDAEPKRFSSPNLITKPVAGDKYQPDGCDCGLPPWELCKPNCQHALRVQ